MAMLATECMHVYMYCMLVVLAEEWLHCLPRPPVFSAVISIIWMRTKASQSACGWLPSSCSPSIHVGWRLRQRMALRTCHWCVADSGTSMHWLEWLHTAVLPIGFLWPKCFWCDSLASHFAQYHIINQHDADLNFPYTLCASHRHTSHKHIQPLHLTLAITLLLLFRMLLQRLLTLSRC